MAASAGISKRYAFALIVLAVAIALVIITVRGGYHRTLHTAITGYVSGDDGSASGSWQSTGDAIAGIRGHLGNASSSGGGGGAPRRPPANAETPLTPLSWRPPSDVKTYRFNNGRIAVANSVYSISEEKLGAMSPAELEDFYENVVLETTADCSTARRFGRREDGGWDLCLVGPFTPQEPCFSFSFGVNNIWEFDDEIAAAFKCQVLTFDPTMAQQSHMRNDKVAFLKEGLHASKGTLNSWSVDSYMGFLKRFGAENYIVDILKMDIEASEWASLETAVRDGSLKNVKQLMLETHISQTGTVKEYQRYFALLRAFHDLGFRQWHHNWNTYGNYASKLNKNQIRTCCHELYYININFLSGGRSARNPSGTKIVAPLALTGGTKIAKVSGNDQVETILGLKLTSMPEASLEGTYFSMIEQQHVSCPYSVRIGDSGDGGWDVCFTTPFNILESKPCIAFSFGINNVWAYDDILADKYKCNVYMYDPSMTTVNDHQRKKTSWFYRTGLSSENKVESNGWKMRTLCTLFSELGYADKTIDILKMDIEHYEWTSFEKAMQEGCLKNVKQLLFETHTSELVRQKSDYARFIEIWRSLFKLGFRTWKWHKNPMSVFFKSAAPPHHQRACCYEHYMLNTKFIESL